MKKTYKVLAVIKFDLTTEHEPDSFEAREAAEEYIDDLRPCHDDITGLTILEKKGPDVIIEVSGGVAEITQEPEGLEVEIKDHDNEAEEGAKK